MHERETVDGAHLLLDVGGIARLSGSALEPLCDMIDDVVRRLAAVDHAGDLHLDLLLTAVREFARGLRVRHQMIFSPW